jgi:hypothetical protein
MSRFAIRTGVTQRGLGPPAWRRAIGLTVMTVGAVCVVVALLSLTGCAATEAPIAVAPAAPGFLLGLWHGFIFPIAWIVSLFVPSVAIYAVPNNGGWYDFGYFLGIVVFGVGAKRGHTVTRNVYRDRGPVVDATARRINGGID